MIDKLHRILRRGRPITPMALGALAVAVAFLAVASAWAFQTVGDYLVFGPDEVRCRGVVCRPGPGARTISFAIKES